MVKNIPSSISSPFGSIKVLTVETLLPFNSTQEVSGRPKGVTILIIMVEGIPSSIFSPFGGIQILTVESLLPFKPTQRRRIAQNELPYITPWLGAPPLQFSARLVRSSFSVKFANKPAQGRQTDQKKLVSWWASPGAPTVRFWGVLVLWPFWVILVQCAGSEMCNTQRTSPHPPTSQINVVGASGGGRIASWVTPKNLLSRKRWSLSRKEDCLKPGTILSRP